MVRHAARAAVIAVLTLVGVLAGPPAGAVPSEVVVTGEHLRLVSVTSTDMTAMSPGSTAYWDVGVSVVSNEEGTVDVSLVVLEASPESFEVQVSRCDQRWTDEGCSAGAITLAGPPVVTGAQTAIDSSTEADSYWYRLSVTMVAGQPGDRAVLRVLAAGAGESISANGSTAGQDLAGTGASVGTLALVSAIAMIGGAALLCVARRQARPTRVDR